MEFLKCCLILDSDVEKSVVNWYLFHHKVCEAIWLALPSFWQSSRTESRLFFLCQSGMRDYVVAYSGNILKSKYAFTVNIKF